MVGWFLIVTLPGSVFAAGVPITLSVAGINPWVAIASGVAGAGAFLFGGRHRWKRLQQRFTSSTLDNNDERGDGDDTSGRDAA
jgi:hypothetical protein